MITNIEDQILFGILGRVGIGNQKVIDCLAQLIFDNYDKNITERIKLLRTVSQEGVNLNFSYAINAILQVITYTQNQPSLRQAIVSLGEIGDKNTGKNYPQLVDALIHLINTYPDNDTRYLTTEYLYEIDEDNPRVITALEEFAKGALCILEPLVVNESTLGNRLCSQAINKLSYIGKNNHQALDVLIKLINTSEDKNARILAIESFDRIGRDNPTVMTNLKNWIKASDDDNIRILAAKTLASIDRGNAIAIAGLENVIKTSNDNDMQILAAENLGLIDPKNSLAIDTLERLSAVESLKAIARINTQAFSALLRFITNNNNDINDDEIAICLWEIDPFNPDLVRKILDNEKRLESNKKLAQSFGISFMKPEPFPFPNIACLNSEFDIGIPSLSVSNPTEKEQPTINIQDLVELIENYKYKFEKEKFDYLGNYYSSYTEEFTEAIEKLGEIKKYSSLAIDFLIKLVNSKNDEWIRREAIKSLGKIGNSKTIYTLENLINKTKNQWTLWQIADSLLEIDENNPQAINVLFNLIFHRDLSLAMDARISLLHKINQDGRLQVIKKMVKLLKKDDYDLNFPMSLFFEEIGRGNSEIFINLVKFIENCSNQTTLKEAIESLSELTIYRNSNNIIAYSVLNNIEKDAISQGIQVLINLLEKFDDDDIYKEVIKALGHIGKSNNQAIHTLSNLVQKYQDNKLGILALENLVKIDPDNPYAIQVLKDLIYQSPEQNFHKAIDILGEMGNSNAIETLKDLFNDCYQLEVCKTIIKTLGKINNSQAIDTLIELFHCYHQQDIRAEIIKRLGEKSPQTLIELISSYPEEDSRREALKQLKELNNPKNKLIENFSHESLTKLVTILKKDYLSEITEQKKVKSDYDYYQMLRQCNSRMSYPEFYQAWHKEKVNYQAKQLNLNNLSQNLNNAIAKYPDLRETIHIISIDGSKFINPDNPAQKIYTAIVKSGYPKDNEGTPKTMVELQTYWDLLESDQIPILIFYDSTAMSNNPKGFSETFLKDLNCFEGAICVITDQRLNGLKQFNPLEPQLIDNIIKWIERICLEE